MTLVQDPEEARQPSMPRSAVALDHVSAVLPLDELVEAITSLAHGEALVV
jgi:chemotaxis response regulator CheB